MLLVSFEDKTAGQTLCALSSTLKLCTAIWWIGEIRDSTGEQQSGQCKL